MADTEFAGRLVKIKIDMNGVGGAGANWAVVAQQRDGGLSRSTETADSSHKDAGGWRKYIISYNTWGVSGGGALYATDPVYQFLESSWENHTKVWAQIDRTAIGGVAKEGQSIITDLSEEFADGDVVAFSLELQGDGELVTSP